MIAVVHAFAIGRSMCLIRMAFACMHAHRYDLGFAEKVTKVLDSINVHHQVSRAGLLCAGGGRRPQIHACMTQVGRQPGTQMEMQIP